MNTLLHSSKLSDSKYKNWIKAGLGILYTKEGLEPFVYNEIEQFQQRCLSDISNNNGLAVGAACSSCCTENVVVCPTNRICNVRRGTCTYHRNAAMRYLPSGCPNKICHNFKNEIQNAHRYRGPSYQNTDASQWCSNPWEVAKCFMPPGGYDDKTSAAETDFNGIISVITNYKAFQSKVKDDLSKAKNIFEQGKKIGKYVGHSPQLQINDTDLQQYFSDLQNILSDPAYLSTNKHAQDAKTKLLQLQNDTLVISKNDIRNMLDDVAEAVNNKVRTKLTEAEKAKLELICFTQKTIKHIRATEEVSISILEKVSKTAIDELEKQTQKSVEIIQTEAHFAKTQIKDCTDKGAKKLYVKAECGVKQIKNAVDKGFDKLKVKAEGDVEKIKKYVDKLGDMLEVKVEAKMSAKMDEALKKIKESTTESKEVRYNKFKEASESPCELQRNDNNQHSENGQPVTEVTKQEQESHGSEENMKNVEPSPDDLVQLKQIFLSPKDKSRRKCTHEGRLLTLEPTQMGTILKFCPKKITGGFGEVFFSKEKIPGLDIKVVVKKIEAGLNLNHKRRSMTNEKLASRTMHFAIVPILANCIEKNENTITCYFLSPYLEKGDLFELIKSDTAAEDNNQSVKLNKLTRMKIMYHVSSAVEFLHRNIHKLRGPIIHLDVKTKNIVLDQFYNARLTDFGISREIAEDEKSKDTSNTQIPYTDGYYQVGTTGKLETFFDCVNLGIGMCFFKFSIQIFSEE